MSRTAADMWRTPFERVLERFPDAKRRGREYLALCPAHDDHHESLNISDRGDGVPLIICRSGGTTGCPAEEILKAIGLSWSDVYGRSEKRLGRQPHQVRRTSAPIEQLDPAYRDLLEALTLSDHHARYLRDEKRLSEETVVRNLYGSMPELEPLAGLLYPLAQRHDLAGIPGFYRDKTGWHLIAKPNELLIPIRNPREQIVALLRKTFSEPKYLYASSSQRGVSCGMVTHFAAPGRVEFDGSVVVTEGILKADCVAELLNCAAIGIPGVDSFRDAFGQELRSLLPAAVDVMVAYDRDVRAKPQVRKALNRLLRSLIAAKYRPAVMTWSDGLGKGIDDVLIAAGREDM